MESGSFQRSVRSSDKQQEAFLTLTRGISPRLFRLVLGLLSVVALLAPAVVQAQTSGPASVHVDPVRKVPLAQTAPVLGSLVAMRRGEVAARVGAPVESFVVDVGDRVARGDPIVLLDDEMLAARADQAQGALAEARARLQTRRERLALAELRLSRLERLRSSAAFSQADFEDQRQEVAIARAEIASAQAEVATAEADLRVARIDLERAEVAAPYAGVITERLVEAGAYVDPGTALVRMVADKELEVAVDVPFRRLTGFAPGDRVDIELEDGTRHTALVRAILPQEDERTRTRTVRLVPSFGETRAPLASGQSVSVAIPLGDSQEVLSVHKDAVLRQGGSASVFVFKDGKAEVRPVQLGREIGSRFEVVEGLKAGDLAVVRGNERLQPGDALRIEKRLGPDATAADQGRDRAEAADDGSPRRRQQGMVVE